VWAERYIGLLSRLPVTGDPAEPVTSPVAGVRSGD